MMKTSRRAIQRRLISLLALSSTTSAWYLPGVAPTSYGEGDLVPLHVNRLTPAPSQEDGQVYSLLSYDYYEEPFHFCQPLDGPQPVSESLGSILFGDRIQTSPFELHMLQNETCKTVPSCGPQEYSAVDAQFVNKKIWQNYAINWLIDGLPAGQLLLDPTTGTEFYSPGFELGYMSDETPVFKNHYDILIEYHQAGKDQYRVVGVLVEPLSNKNTRQPFGGGTTAKCESPEPLILNDEGGTKVTFTYSVYWRFSSTPFATRWDKYLHVYDPRIHWLSLVNAAVIVMMLSGMVFVILVRTLKRDITRYNKLDSFVLEDVGASPNGNANGHAIGDLDDGVQEDSGWKLVHGDVFRPPRHPLVLSVMVGNGAQLFVMAGFTIAFAMFGFISPSSRGSLGSSAVLLYTLLSALGGFVSAYTYKCLGGEDATRWKENLILTPLALPVGVFGTFFLLDLFLWAKRSSGAVPFTTMLVIVGIWFVISLPLSFAGSYLAFKRRPVQAPVRTNMIPRQIPDARTQSSGILSWLTRPLPAVMLTGLLPFGAIFVEIHFIMSSLWSNKIYYMFGFLFVCYGLMVVTCATVTVLNVYFLLCAEDYRWQWRSFVTSGSCAVYVFLNALIFWASRLSFGSWTSGVLYLGYSALISGLIFILTGTIGFFASWLFVHRIYKSIKVD